MAMGKVVREKEGAVRVTGELGQVVEEMGREELGEEETDWDLVGLGWEGWGLVLHNTERHGTRVSSF